MSDAVCDPIPLAPGRYAQGPFVYELEPIAGPAGPGWRFHHDPGGSFGGMDFYEVPARRHVVDATHLWLSTAPESPFTRLLSVGRRDLLGAEVLRGRVLIRWDVAGRREHRFDDVAEWFGFLADEHGIPLDDLDPEAREALWHQVYTAHVAWETAQLGSPPAGPADS